jgi:hypothetical protein
MKSVPNLSTALLLFVALSASGCIRARLLNPVSPETAKKAEQTTPGTFSAGGGTLHGTGVTLQANFTMAAGSPLTGTGVQLQTGP